MESLRDLYIDQLKDLYDAELRLVETLPQLAEEAGATELRAAFRNHLEETKNQVTRLERIFARHDLEPDRETCTAMKGILAEGDKEMKKWSDTLVRDAAMIASAQRVEHYEMAAYGSARAYAKCLGYTNDVDLLDETLAEEKATDAKLTQIAMAGVNESALDVERYVREDASSRFRI